MLYIGTFGRSLLCPKGCWEDDVTTVSRAIWAVPKHGAVPEGGKWRTALEPGAVGEAVGHNDVLVEVVGARGAVTFHLVDHLADGEDG